MVNARAKPNLRDDEQNYIAQWLLQHSCHGQLLHGSKKEAADQFGVSLKTIYRIWKKASQQQVQGLPVQVKSLKKGCAHSDKWSIDREKVKNLSVLQRSSLRVMAGNLGVSKSLVHNWVQAKMLKPHTNAIKPFLTPENMLSRLSWSLSQLSCIVENGTIKFQNMYNTVHVDEKWFYLTKDKDKYYLLADEEQPHRTCKSKRFIPKIMFNCAVSRPIIDKEGNIIFDGKFGIFPFITEEAAKRNSKNRVKGTMETHPMPSITKEVMKTCLIKKMLPAIKAKWPTCLSKQIYIQQDNAKPHIKGTDPDFLAAAKSDGFDIHLICQPPNSPDTNVNDLGFFRAIQSLKDQKPASGVDDLLANVEEAFQEYDPVKLNHVFLTLQGCYTEIMKVKGGNRYQIPHMGKGRLERMGLLPEVLEVDEELVRQSLEILNQQETEEANFYNLDNLVEGLKQVEISVQ